MTLAPLFAWIVIATTALLMLASACSDDSANPSDPQSALPVAPTSIVPTSAPKAISTPTPMPTSTPRPTSTSVPEIDDVARKLAIVSGKNDQTTRQRFKFIIGELVDTCPDISRLTRAGDHLVIAHNQLDEVGLSSEERLIDVANNLYFIVQSIDSFADSNDVPMFDCLELFASYTALRHNAWSAQEAREGVVDIAISFYNLGQ